MKYKNLQQLNNSWRRIYGGVGNPQNFSSKTTNLIMPLPLGVMSVVVSVLHKIMHFFIFHSVSHTHFSTRSAYGLIADVVIHRATSYSSMVLSQPEKVLGRFNHNP